MGSFVPFGGFFSTPSEIKTPVSCTNASFTRCDKCNEKYEQEVADVLKSDPATLASSCSTSLPWLQKVVHVDTHGGLDVAKVCYDHLISDFLVQFTLRHSHAYTYACNMVGAIVVLLIHLTNLELTSTNNASLPILVKMNLAPLK